MAESDIQRGSLRALRSLGFWAIRFGVRTKRSRSSTISGEPGTPDTCVMGLGWIEYKASEDDELNPAQVTWHAKAAKVGVRVATVWTIAQAVSVARAWRDEEERLRRARPGT